MDPSTAADPAGRPENLIFGLFDLQIRVNNAGGAAVVTFYLPRSAPDQYRWYKFSTAGGWTDYSTNTVFNSDRDQVAITLVDGGCFISTAAEDSPVETLVKILHNFRNRILLLLK